MNKLDEYIILNISEFITSNCYCNYKDLINLSFANKLHNNILKSKIKNIKKNIYKINKNICNNLKIKSDKLCIIHNANDVYFYKKINESNILDLFNNNDDLKLKKKCFIHFDNNKITSFMVDNMKKKFSKILIFGHRCCGGKGISISYNDSTISDINL